MVTARLARHRARRAPRGEPAPETPAPPAPAPAPASTPAPPAARPSRERASRRSEPPDEAATETTRPRGEAVVRAVLTAALDELGSVGFAALSIERVAERAGVNKTTVYRRYPTKADLLVAALKAKQDSLSTRDTGNLRDDLIAMLVNAGCFLEEPRGKGLFRMLMTERADPEVEQFAKRMHRERERGPMLIFQRAIARGELAPETNLELLLHIIVGPVMHRVILEGLPLDRKEAEDIVDIVLHGALKPEARRR